MLRRWAISINLLSAGTKVVLIFLPEVNGSKRKKEGRKICSVILEMCCKYH
jgi:hypothetical protein